MPSASNSLGAAGLQNTASATRSETTRASTKFDPAKKDTWQLPAELLDAGEIKLAARTKEYYIVPYSLREPMG